MKMTQTNVVPIDQKQERAPHLRNIDLPVEQQLSDLEIRLEKQMQICRAQVVTIQRYEKTINEHNHTWRSIFAHMQDCGLDIVTRDDLESEVSDIINMNSDVVTQENLNDTVKDSISELTFSVTVE